MTAKGDGFTVLVAAVRVAATAAVEIDQRQQARTDADTAEFHWLSAIGRRPPLARLGRATLARFPRAGLRWLRRLVSPRRLRPAVGPFGAAKPHALAAADRGVAGEAGAELRINRVRDFRIGQAARDKLAQRLGMLRRPIARLHDLPFRDARRTDRARIARRAVNF